MALEQLRYVVTKNRGAMPPPEDLSLGASVHIGGKKIEAMASIVSRTGAYIVASHEPQPGQAMQIELRTFLARLDVRGHCVYTLDAETAKQQGRPAGFGVAFDVSGVEQNVLESFLIAANRKRAWPEKSGRQHERFPIRLRVAYEHQGQARKEYTQNLSRGGLFLESLDPPGLGSELKITVYALGSDTSAVLHGKVVRVIDADEAAGRKMHPGVGVEFTEGSDVAADKVRELLAYVPSERRRRAMLVDDDRFFREVISHSLGLAGYEVLQAGSGEDAFALLVEELLHLDVLILDLYLPGIGGAELVRRLRKIGDKLGLAVVVVTGATLNDDLRLALESMGADTVIPKRVSRLARHRRREDRRGRRGEAGSQGLSAPATR
jgi:CheY-like chemotaxis protein